MSDIPPGDTNLLWIRSRGTCAHPDCGATLVELDGDRWVTLAERAHIRSAKIDGPRYEATYQNPNGYENLILLCRRHHRLIDAQPDLYPTELLDQWKRNHEDYAAPVLTIAPPPEGSLYRRRLDLYVSLEASIEQHGTVALVGISGIGKSQLAGDYFRSSVDSYSVRAWIRAESKAIMLQDFALLGHYVGLAEMANEPIDVYCARIREALALHPGWLVVFDGATDEASVTDVMPVGLGHVILTSQSQSWMRPTVLKAPDLTTEEALAILDADREFSGLDPQGREAAAELAGGVPLCLAQLMSYQSATGMGAQQVVELFRDRRAQLLERGAPPDHSSLQTALVAAFEALSPAARDLLGALAYLAADPLPTPTHQRELSGPEAASGISPVFTSRLQLEDAVAILRNFSLVERDQHRISVHSLVQEFVRGQHSDDDARTGKMMALLLVGEALPERADREDLVNDALVLLPHAKALVGHLARVHGTGVLLAHILNRLAPAYGLIGDHSTEAVELARALDLLESDTAGQELSLRAAILNNLSNCRSHVGQLDEAIALASEAVTIKRSIGASPDSLAISLGAYGTHLESDGRLAEALAAHQEATGLLESQPGRLLAEAEIDQAGVLLALDQPDESHSMLLKALEHAESDDSAWSERSAAHLGLSVLIEAKGDVLGALQEVERAVEAACVFDRPSSARAKALARRGRYLDILGRTPEAIQDLHTAAEMFEASGGRGLDYATTLGNLGGALVRLGIEANEPVTSGDGMVRLRESWMLIQQLVPVGHPAVDIAEQMMREAQLSLLDIP
jgi:tetratricopeptide (TPR) repeat protein